MNIVSANSPVEETCSVTTSDISRRSGVSRSTAAAVLNVKADVRESMREKVTGIPEDFSNVGLDEICAAELSARPSTRIDVRPYPHVQQAAEPLRNAIEEQTGPRAISQRVGRGLLTVDLHAKCTFDRRGGSRGKKRSRNYR